MGVCFHFVVNKKKKNGNCIFRQQVGGATLGEFLFQKKNCAIFKLSECGKNRRKKKCEVARYHGHWLDIECVLHVGDYGKRWLKRILVCRAVCYRVICNLQRWPWCADPKSLNFAGRNMRILWRKIQASVRAPYVMQLVWCSLRLMLKAKPEVRSSIVDRPLLIVLSSILSRCKLPCKIIGSEPYPPPLLQHTTGFVGLRHLARDYICPKQHVQFLFFQRQMYSTQGSVHTGREARSEAN